MYYTYVLRSFRDGKLYIGYSENLRKRFRDHQLGVVESTRARRPFELLFYEAFKEQEDALRRERYFKTTKGKAALKKMLWATAKDTAIQP